MRRRCRRRTRLRFTAIVVAAAAAASPSSLRYMLCDGLIDGNARTRRVVTVLRRLLCFRMVDHHWW